MRPILFASKCLGFGRCRWDGDTISDHFIESLKARVDFITACPEMEIGLGVPRDPIRIVKDADKLHLKSSGTGCDLSADMSRFTDKFLSSIGDIDGFILKAKSPSCGISDVKVYPRLGPCDAVARGHGFFGVEVLSRFSHLPVETEASLTNFKVREHFLVRIFASASLRDIKAKGNRA